MDSTQWRWLRDDLRASTASCTLAYWHHPRFSSGPGGGAPWLQAFWQLLYGYGAELLLSGHDHLYERFMPLNAAGAGDSTRKGRQFVVGTGGHSLYKFGTPHPGSEARNQDTFGVLKLTLHTRGYDWSFLPITGQTPRDAGSDVCH